MVPDSQNFARIESIQLINHGIFQGENEFEFDKNVTVIAGDSNSGKSTLFNALRKFSLDDEISNHIPANSEPMPVTVTTSGNRELLRKYKNLIFIDEGTHVQCLDDLLPVGLSKNQITRIEYEARRILLVLANKDFHDYVTCKNFTNLSIGEQVCITYSFNFAVRKVLSIDVPIVIASPCNCLDDRLKAGLNEFLAQQAYQQIYIVSTNQLDRLHPAWKIQYLLQGGHDGN